MNKDLWTTSNKMASHWTFTFLPKFHYDETAVGRLALRNFISCFVHLRWMCVQAYLDLLARVKSLTPKS